MSEKAMVASIKLPGLNCGACGFKTCEEMGSELSSRPDLAKRCIHISPDKVAGRAAANCRPEAGGCAGCGTASAGEALRTADFFDSLGREFDFFLEHFPEDPGPREIIIPHNPVLTREMDVRVGDILIGRPLGMSCGCPITHCGVAREVDSRTGVIVWCVTGPLNPRQKGYKDLGYYIAEGYEGLINSSREEVKIGKRYYFQPRMCMLQWRHSGLVSP